MRRFQDSSTTLFHNEEKSLKKDPTGCHYDVKMQIAVTVVDEAKVE